MHRLFNDSSDENIKKNLLEKFQLYSNSIFKNCLEYRLTKELFLAHWQNGKFSIQHMYALKELIVEQSISPTNALTMIEGLSAPQARLVGKGYTREAVLPLNDTLIAVLEELQGFNLTAEHLLTSGYENYNNQQSIAFYYLIRKSISPDKVIAVIPNLTSYQAFVLTEYQLEIEDVIGLNEYQIEALRTLSNKGLIREQLREQLKAWNEQVFTQEHAAILCQLVLDEGYPVDRAIEKMLDYSTEQIVGMWNGKLDFQEVKNLNKHHISALIRYKKLGITGDHFRTLGNMEFTVEHIDALGYYLKQMKISPEEAITSVRNLDEEAALCLAAGINPPNIQKFNKEKIVALKKLRQYDIIGVLEEWPNEAFTGFHASALINLIKKRNFSVESAFNEIENTTYEQARAIGHGFTRNAAMKLNDMQQVTLAQYQNVGMTEEILESWSGPEFSYGHILALSTLIKMWQLSPQNAMEQINGLSESEAGRFFRRSKDSISREKILKGRQHKPAMLFNI